MATVSTAPDCTIATFLQLTPNRRIAQSLENAFSLEEWLHALTPNALSTTEELIIWEKIISASDLGDSLLRASTTARQVASAWHSCMDWRLDPFGFEQGLKTDEVDAFIEWAKAYQTRCQKEGWVDSCARVDTLISSVKNGSLVLPEQIVLIGFDELSPQLKMLFDCIEQAGTVILRRSLLGTKSEVHALGAPNAETELLWAAHQAKVWLGENPSANIGIVVPDLEKRRQNVDRIFQETLCEKQFNIAAPIALIAYPFISAALLGLGLVKEYIPLETISVWLRSPFFSGGMSESYGRASVDVFLREQGETVFSWTRLIALLKYYHQDESPFCLPLEKFHLLRATLSLKSKKTSAEWCEVIQALLECLGWPGERTANSQEFQLKMRWDALLLEYCQLGRVLGKHRFSETLFRLRTLAQTLSFLPQSHHPRVHILGVLEASGLPFDYLWVLGLHREAWPLEPAPNPFIPLSLQRKLELPRSSAKRELMVAKRLTDNLCRGAPVVIFSYPKTIEEESRQKSSLLNDFAMMDPEILGFHQLKGQLSRFGVIRVYPSVSAIEEQAPMLLDKEKIRQGARSLQLQAACPFKAFAEIRLAARPMPKNTLGLTPEIRGEMLHQILMHFWDGLVDQAALVALSEVALKERLDNAIELACNHWQTRRPRTLTPKFLALERKRLFELVLRFIALEKSRPPFEVVEREQRHTLSLAGFQLSVRIDRVDRLASGEEMVLDYKTGLTSIAHWFGERPKDPQLPLYCVTRFPISCGIAFVSLRPEGPKFQGVAKMSDATLPGIKSVADLKRWGSETTWEAQCQAWETTLVKLAEDFSQGIALVDPVDGPNTCRTCSLQSLCRISEKVEIYQSV